MPSHIDEARLNTALRLIYDSMNNRGYPPSRRELADLTGRTSSESGDRLINRLEREGLIEVDRTVARGIRITSAGMAAIVTTF